MKFEEVMTNKSFAVLELQRAFLFFWKITAVVHVMKFRSSVNKIYITAKQTQHHKILSMTLLHPSNWDIFWIIFFLSKSQKYLSTCKRVLCVPEQYSTCQKYNIVNVLDPLPCRIPSLISNCSAAMSFSFFWKKVKYLTCSNLAHVWRRCYVL